MPVCYVMLCETVGVFVMGCKVINALMKAVGCSHRAAADFATTVDREVCLKKSIFVRFSMSCTLFVRNSSGCTTLLVWVVWGLPAVCHSTFVM